MNSPLSPNPNYLKSGKPVLVTASCKFITTHSPRIIELDYDVREWAYAMRVNLGTLFSKGKQSYTEFGWLVEGRSDDELPEQILCCCAAKPVDMLELPFARGR